MARISPSFIQDLLTRTDIVELINERVPLQKKGNNYFACCPFHEEKTPSFSVNPQKQIFHCFGCKKSGHAIGFLMEYEHLGFVDAVEKLAQGIGIKVQYEGGYVPRQSTTEFQKFFAAMDTTTSYYVEQLQKAPHVQKYLAQRGISETTIKQFNLGYAPPGFDSMKALFGKQYNEDLLKKLGLLANKNTHCYARFRDRIMFPIRNTRGQTIAFGARLLKNEDNQAKYLNSPETPLFRKREVIYGVYELQRTHNFDRLILVEGYMDVIALAQAGASNSVATLGTAITAQQLQKIFQLNKRLVVCLDGDEAGRKASEACMREALTIFQDEYSISFATLPANKDPDNFVKEQGLDALNKLLDHAQPLSDYLFTYLKGNLDLDTPDGQANFCAQTRPVLATIHSQTFRKLITQSIAQRANIEEEHLATTSAQQATKERRSTTLGTLGSGASKLSTPGAFKRLLIKMAQIIVGNPEFAQCDNMAHINFKKVEDSARRQNQEVQAGAALLERLIVEIKKYGIENTAALIEHYADHHDQKVIVRLSNAKLPPYIEDEFDGCVRKLQQLLMDDEAQTLINKASLDTADKERLRKLQSRDAS